MTTASSDNRLNIDAALLAYLVPVLGPLYILLARRDDAFARFHAWQSLQIVFGLVAAPVAWFVFAWLAALLPYGGVVGAYVFALVVAAYFAAIFAWIAGVANALRGRRAPVPFFGNLFRRFK